MKHGNDIPHYFLAVSVLVTSISLDVCSAVFNLSVMEERMLCRVG